MSDLFYSQPILNNPYEPSTRHWETTPDGRPTQKILEYRRPCSLVTPIPKPKRRRKSREGWVEQQEMVLDEGQGLSSEEQQYDATSTINLIRSMVTDWRLAGYPNVLPETLRLLQHWRDYDFLHFRPFFCQREAAETVIWLTEVAPQGEQRARRAVERLQEANAAASGDLARLALKMATGAGKTTVMAMLIAWQTINAVSHPNSRRFTKGFLVVTPGITIRDRLRVLQPNDPDAYYQERELVPKNMMEDVLKAKIVITNFHAFQRRETMPLSSGGRRLLQGRSGEALETLESEGQMMQRVMPELMGMRSIMVLNDEAHHCYREKAADEDDVKLKGDERKEAAKRNQAARLWINGLEAVGRKLRIRRVIDLSATPFFLRGSGYQEGTLFPWTMSDFSLMDAIECGIVKLPRVPVADNIPGGEMPRYRELWKHIGKKMPRKGRGKAKQLDPLELPVELQTALEALYGHYQKTYQQWQDVEMNAPPCFIIVCQNTSISKLIYDYVSGFVRENADGTEEAIPGRFALFRNQDDYGNAYGEPRTLLIDSEQLESGEGLDRSFRQMNAEAIERFRREETDRSGLARPADAFSDAEILREVMNTVGKPDRLGSSIRCVVSVSMLTEGWDAQNVTHILGVRAFGTQLLCEQVVGRALRRMSYELNAQNLYDVEYADILGIPFDFASQPIDAPVRRPKKVTVVEAVSPERDALEIRFPCVEGYRVEQPQGRLRAAFTADSRLELTPELVGPSITRDQGIIGEGVDLTLEHLEDMRQSTLLFTVTGRLMARHWPSQEEGFTGNDFGDLKRIVRQWLDTYLVCRGNTYPALLCYQELCDLACERITAAINRAHLDEAPVRALLEPYNPEGSTQHVRFLTSKETLWETDARKCHLNWVVCDSDWEAEFCRVVEGHARTLAYCKNQGLGLTVPYHLGGVAHRYVPDFVVLLDDGRGWDDPLRLIVETKGYRGVDAQAKAETMETLWVPGVNRLRQYGRWAFCELREVFRMQDEFGAAVEAAVNGMLARAAGGEGAR